MTAWTPDQPLLATATDEQMSQRALQEGESWQTIAREFADACAVKAADDVWGQVFAEFGVADFDSLQAISSSCHAQRESGETAIREAVREALTKLAEYMRDGMPAEAKHKPSMMAFAAALYTDISLWRDREYPAPPLHRRERHET